MNIDKSPLVSVIIPSYNHEKYISLAIDSIINQTYKNIELIIVNDNSQDATGFYIDSYNSKCITRFINYRYINHTVNLGLIKTLNEVIPLTFGKYICIVASDDIFMNDKIQIQVDCFENLINRNEIAAIWSNGFKIDSIGDIMKINDLPDLLVNQEFGLKTNNNHHIKNYQWLFDYGWYITTPSIMYRKDVLIELDLFDERYTLEDFEMMLRVLKLYNIFYIDKNLVSYRFHPYNYTKRYSKQFVQNYLNIIEREYNFCNSNGMIKSWEKLIKIFFIAYNNNLLIKFLFKYNLWYIYICAKSIRLINKSVIVKKRFFPKPIGRLKNI